MYKLTIKLLTLTLFFNTTSLLAQDPEALKLFVIERWDMAGKAFDKSPIEENKFYKGICLVNLGKMDEAKEVFNSMATFPYGKIGLGLFELNAKNTANAEQLFNSAVKETKNTNGKIFAAISQAYQYSKLDDKSKGIEWAKKCVETKEFKNNGLYYILYGNAFLATTDGGSAITQYEYAQNYDKNSSIPDAKIGQVYFRNRSYSMAKDYLYKSLAKNPKDLMALDYLAWIFYNTNKLDSAQIYQQQLIDNGDKTPEDMAMLANIYFKQKNYDKAIEVIKEVTSKNNKYNYLNRLIGYSYIETGKPKEGLDYMNKFFAEQPKDKIIPSDYLYLGQAQLQTGTDTMTALKTMSKALELDPNNHEMLVDLAKAYEKMGRKKDAIEVYKKVCALPDVTFDDYKNLGQLLYLEKDYAGAIEYYTKALAINPNSAATTYLRALANLRNEPGQETASAKPDFTKFLELSADNAGNYKNQIIKAKLYLAKDAIKNMNDKPLADKYCNEILAIDPENAAAKDLLTGHYNKEIKAEGE